MVRIGEEDYGLRTLQLTQWLKKEGMWLESRSWAGC